MDDYLISKLEARRFTTLGRTAFDDAVRSGMFPAPLKITEKGRRVAWLRSEVEAWVEARKRARDAAQARTAGGTV